VSGKVLFKVFFLAVIGSFTIASQSLSEDGKCILRVGNFDLQPNEHFAGMFRIPLISPNSHDPVAVQRHLAFSEIWADTIMSDRSWQAGGLCGAVILPYQFPDLRVFLVVNRTGSQIDREKATCMHALERFLERSEPNDELIKQAAKRNALFNQLSQPAPGAAFLEPALDSENILRAALPLIYERASTLHALSSLVWATFATVDAADLRIWIQGQRLPERALLVSIPHCLPPRGDLASSAVVPRERSESGILPAGEISLARSPDGPLPAGSLRYAVIVGDPDEPPSLAAASEVKAKYCDRQHSFSISDGSLPRGSLMIRPRCDSRAVYDLDSWTVIYCDPADCASQAVEKAIMAAIASDPEVLDYARRSSNTTIPRGPYLVTIK
jgi:hypothetical protein